MALHEILYLIIRAVLLIYIMYNTILYAEETLTYLEFLQKHF